MDFSGVISYAKRFDQLIVKKAVCMSQRNRATPGVPLQKNTGHCRLQEVLKIGYAANAQTAGASGGNTDKIESKQAELVNDCQGMLESVKLLYDDHMLPSTGGPEDDASRSIMGLLTGEPATLYTVRGLARVLVLCQLNSSYAELFNCNDPDMWQTAYTKADSRISKLNDYHQHNARQILVRIEDAKTHVEANIKRADRYTDEEKREVANYYKELLIKHVVYFTLYETVELTGVFATKEERYEALYLADFETQLQTFLRRTNGSINAVLLKLNSDMRSKRDRIKDFPPVPADFFVAAIDIVEKVVGQTNIKAEPGHIQALKVKVQSQKFY